MAEVGGRYLRIQAAKGPVATENQRQTPEALLSGRVSRRSRSVEATSSDLLSGSQRKHRTSTQQLSRILPNSDVKWQCRCAFHLQGPQFCRTPCLKQTWPRGGSRFSARSFVPATGWQLSFRAPALQDFRRCIRRSPRMPSERRTPPSTPRIKKKETRTWGIKCKGVWW